MRRDSCHILMKLYFLDRFPNNPEILIFVKTSPFGDKLYQYPRTDIDIDGHAEANIRFPQFRQRPYKRPAGVRQLRPS